MRIGRLGRRDVPAPDEAQVTPTRAASRALDFAVESFECVPVDEENALLRVRGAWGEEPIPEPDLAVHVSGRSMLYEPLPGAGGEPGGWQAGYAPPATEISRGARFSLRAGTRSVTLPVPSRSPDLRGEPAKDQPPEREQEPGA